MGNLQAKTGLKTDFPTKVQWEYVSRADTVTAYSYGATPNIYCQWDSSNSAGETQKVAGKLANPWGLF